MLVCYDLLGLTSDLRPKFVKRYAEWFEEGVEAAGRYCAEVRAGTFPSAEHAFGDVKPNASVAGAPAAPKAKPTRRKAYGPEA